jgi:hypothetical protein
MIFDRRMGGFDKAPCCTFGYRNTNAKFQQSYTKGSIHHTFFVRGHQDGTVVLWDFRNAKVHSFLLSNGNFFLFRHEEHCDEETKPTYSVGRAYSGFGWPRCDFW